MREQESKEERYLRERWQSQRDYYSKQAKRNKWWHQSLLLFSSISALVVPVLFNIAPVPTWIPTTLSVLVSITLLLENTYHFGDNWQTFRRTLEALKQERIYFEAGVTPYTDTQATFPLFVERCEGLIRAEGKIYFEQHKPQEQLSKGQP